MKFLILSAMMAGLSANAFADDSQIIDFTIPTPAQLQSPGMIYDQVQLNQPNFAVNQNDPRLSDLFNAKGVSELCFPSAFAQTLISLYAYHNPKMLNLKLDGLTQNQQGIDPSSLVRSLAGLCKTDPTNGSVPPNELACVAQEMQNSGYNNSSIVGISNFITQSPTGATAQTRSPTSSDIKSFLDAGYSVMVDVGWYNYNSVTSTWTRSGGHAVSVVGYFYDNSWSDSQILLIVLNPNLSYDKSGTILLGDTITMLKIDRKPGIIYPANISEYSFTGNRFPTNFVEAVIAYQPIQ